MKPDIKGLRTYTFSVIALIFLLSGFAMALGYPVTGVALFSSFAAAVVGIVAMVAGKSTVAALGNGNGIKGVVNTLMTDAKPGDPHTPSQTTPPGAGKAS